MTYRVLAGLAILSTLGFVRPGPASAQTQFRIPLYVADKTPKRDTIWFGVHPQASYCIDNVTLKFGDCDTILEAEQPPAPPTGVFDVRFIDVRSGPGACLGVGVGEDIKGFTGSSDVDTFQIKFQPGSGGYPFTFKWPANLSQFADSMIIKDGFTGGLLARANMFTSDSLQVTNSLLSSLMLYVYHPKSPSYPNVPAPTAPADAATGVDTNAVFTWGAAANATGYILHVSASPTFASYVLRETLATTTKNLRLPANGTYYWRVSAVHPFLTGCFSPVRSFATLTTGPPTPVLTAPSNNATGVAVSPTLSWNASTGATSYQVQVATSSNFSVLVVNDSGITTTSRQVGPLPNCVTRFWRVRAKNDLNQYSQWQDAPFAFTTALAAPGAPTPVSPADNAPSQPTTLTLSWTGADSCSKSYRLEVSDDSLFASPLVFDNLAATSRSVGPLDELTTYFWRVRAKNQGTDTGSYGPVRRFTTLLNAPSAPSIVSPANGDTAVPAAALLRWLSSTHVDSYQVQVATDAAFASIVEDRHTVDTSLLASPLENCRTFYWRVRGMNAAGTGPYASRNFRVERALSSAPSLLTPANNALNVDENTTLTWAGEPCAFQYRVELATDSLFTQMVADQTVSTLSLSVGPLAGNTEHFWRVRGVNNLGQGTPSAFFRFRTTALTTPPVPVLLSPSSGASSLPLPVTLCWDSAARATSYRLQVAVDSNFATMTYNDTSSGANRCRQFTFLLNSTTYYWRVNASNSAGTSAWSAVSHFSTLSPPAAPTLISPANNAEGVTAAPVFTWSVPQNAVSYRLQVARDSAFTSIFSDDSSLVNTSWQTGPLQSHTRYYWRVMAKNSVGTGPWSPAFTFRTTFIGVANWLMPLAIRETGMARDTLYLGLHPDATCGIEPWLGEFELPPPPFPGTFDARFIGTGNQACDLGAGLRVNLLPFVTYTQVDTYRVRFQPGTGTYPIVLSWDRNFITTVCDSMVIRDEFGGSTVYSRMDAVGSVSVASSSITSLLLVKYGAFPLINDVKPPAPGTPSGFMLSQNYPNPFNPTTRITFSTEHDARVRVAVFDVLGREVTVLADGEYHPGFYTVPWDGRNASGSPVPSGAYYLRMVAAPFGNGGDEPAAFSEVRKMLLMK